MKAVVQTVTTTTAVLCLATIHFIQPRKLHESLAGESCCIKQTIIDLTFVRKRQLLHLATEQLADHALP